MWILILVRIFVWEFHKVTIPSQPLRMGCGQSTADVAEVKEKYVKDEDQEKDDSIMFP